MGNQKDSRTLGRVLIVLGIFTLPLGIILIILGVRKLKADPDGERALPSAVPAEHAAAPVDVPSPPSHRAATPVTVVPDLDGSTFGAWDISVHGADGQDLRFDRALFQQMTIQSYDPAAGVAEILGTHGEVYTVTLDSCTCEDFQRRGLPCKHIYKLALSRGYSADAFFSARHDVVWYADGCRVYHEDANCRGLRNRYSRRSTVAMAEYQGLRPCKSCCDR